MAERRGQISRLYSIGFGSQFRRVEQVQNNLSENSLKVDQICSLYFRIIYN